MIARNMLQNATQKDAQLTKAIKILTDLINKCIMQKMHGKATVTVSFEHGKIVLIRKGVEETIKPGGTT